MTTIQIKLIMPEYQLAVDTQGVGATPSAALRRAFLAGLQTPQMKYKRLTYGIIEFKVIRPPDEGLDKAKPKKGGRPPTTIKAEKPAGGAPPVPVMMKPIRLKGGRIAYVPMDGTD